MQCGLSEALSVVLVNTVYVVFICTSDSQVFHALLVAWFLLLFSALSIFSISCNNSNTSAGVIVTKKPVGLARQDGKRPNGATLIPWQRGKPLTWDITVVHTLADSFVSMTARSGGAAAGRKTAKYDLLVQTGHLFQPITAEALGPLNESSITFFSELGRKTVSISGDNQELICFKYWIIYRIVMRQNVRDNEEIEMGN